MDQLHVTEPANLPDPTQADNAASMHEVGLPDHPARMPGFHRLSVTERVQLLRSRELLSQADHRTLTQAAKLLGMSRAKFAYRIKCMRSAGKGDAI